MGSESSPLAAVVSDPRMLRHEIEAAFDAGCEPATIRPLFRAYADAMEERLDTITRELLRLDVLSLTDPLTGVHNRRALDLRLLEEVGHARRLACHVAVIFVDIDNFKGFNDCYGHAAGDGALRTIAGALMESARRPGDFVARYGGEEFVVILPGVNSVGAFEVAKRMRSAIHDAAIVHERNDERGIATASFGVASLIPQSDVAWTAGALLEYADLGLRAAKDEGRDRITVHETLTGKRQVARKS